MIEPPSPGTSGPLAGLLGGRVLDVATGDGQFLDYLREELHDVDEMIGIDLDETAEHEFANRHGSTAGIRFERQDARAMTFPAASFDTVSIAHALCEFDDPAAALRGMVGLLRPGGHLVVAESFREQSTEAAQSHVLVHDWWAAVESLDGVSHRPFMTRAELIDLVRSTGLVDVADGEVPPDPLDPWDPATLSRIGTVNDSEATARPRTRVSGRRASSCVGE